MRTAAPRSRAGHDGQEWYGDGPYRRNTALHVKALATSELSVPERVWLLPRWGGGLLCPPAMAPPDVGYHRLGAILSQMFGALLPWQRPPT